MFKRDHFTCVYCGRSAPEVVLHVDHVLPVSEGGTNDVGNLVTACADCNLGKGASIIDTGRNLTKKQLRELKDRREQIELLQKWNKELLEIKNIELEEVVLTCNNRLLEAGLQLTVNNGYKGELRQLLNKFTAKEVNDAINIAFDAYVITSKEDAEKALSKVPGICFNKRREREDPAFAHKWHLINILKKRGFYTTAHLENKINDAVIKMLKRDECDDYIETLYNYAYNKSISDFKDFIEEQI